MVSCFFSFALFFAMIFADAGYSATLGLILAALLETDGSIGCRSAISYSDGDHGRGCRSGHMAFWSGSYFGISPG